MKIQIIGENKISEKLKEAMFAAELDAFIVHDVEAADPACDLVILNTTPDLDTCRNEVKILGDRTSAPIAVMMVLDYVSAVARDIADKHRVIGLRVMGEAFIGQYIEITKSMDTDETTYHFVKNILKSFNDHVVDVPDIIGGLFYRMMPVQPNMAAFLVSEGVTPIDVDNSMRYGTNIKRPPLQIMDELGLDYVLEITERIYRETGRPVYRPSPLLRKMVNAGRLGKNAAKVSLNTNNRGAHYGIQKSRYYWNRLNGRRHCPGLRPSGL